MAAKPTTVEVKEMALIIGDQEKQISSLTFKLDGIKASVEAALR